MQALKLMFVSLMTAAYAGLPVAAHADVRLERPLALARAAHVEPGGQVLVGVSARGNAVAVWPAQRRGREQLRVALRGASGRFGASRVLTAGRDLLVMPAPPVIGGDGRAVVAWAESHGDIRQIKAAVAPAGGSFGRPQLLESIADAPVAPPSLAIDSQGVVTIAWWTGRGATGLHVAAAGADSGTFGAPQAIAGSDGQFVVAGGRSGTWLATCEPAGVECDHIAVRHRALGATEFAVPVIVPAGASRAPTELNIASDGAGNTTLLWQDGDGPESYPHGAITTASLGVGGGWSPVTRLTGFGQLKSGARDPRLAVAADGAALAVWEQGAIRKAFGHVARSAVRLTMRPVGGAFGPARRISATREIATDPAIAGAAGGQAIVAWNSNQRRVIVRSVRPDGTLGARRALRSRDGQPSLSAAGGFVAVGWTGPDGRPMAALGRA